MQRGKTLGTIVTEIEKYLNNDPALRDIVLIAAREHKSNDMIGFVLAYRPKKGDYITWLWNSAHRYTALYEGHYDMEYEEALMDFEARK